MALVGELATRSEDFRTWWGGHTVRIHTSGTKRNNHPVIGELTLALLTSALQGEPVLQRSVEERRGRASDALAVPARVAPVACRSGARGSDVLDLRSTHEAHSADVPDVRKLPTVEESFHLRRSQLQDSCCRADGDPVRVSVVQVASPGIRSRGNRFRLPGGDRAAMEQL
jgi:hypothetical protein